MVPQPLSRDGGAPPQPAPPQPVQPPGPGAKVIDVTPATASDRLHTALLVACATLLAVLIGMGGVLLWRLDHPHSPPGPAPPPAPVVDPEGVALGRAFVAPLASSLADGSDAFAAAIEGGKSVDDADLALKATFQASRTAAFSATVAPAAAKIVTDGSAIDDAARARYVQFWRGFSRGLRGK